MPSHAWSYIGFSAYVATLAVVSIAGLFLGYPQVMFIWLLLLFGGWSVDCECPDCSEEPRPEERESAQEIISREYAKGNITDDELERKLGQIERINRTNENELEYEFQLEA